MSADLETLRKSRPPEIDPDRWEDAITRTARADGEVSKISKGVSMTTFSLETITKAANAFENAPDRFTAPEIKKALDDLVEQERKALEPSDVAFSRVALSHPIGKRIFASLRRRQKAYGESDMEAPQASAPVAPADPLNTTTHGRMLAELADQHVDGDAKLRNLRETDPGRARSSALLTVMETPKGRDLWRKHRSQIASGSAG